MDSRVYYLFAQVLEKFPEMHSNVIYKKKFLPVPRKYFLVEQISKQFYQGKFY